MLHVMQIHIINTYVFEGGPLEMEREISSGVGKQKGGGVVSTAPLKFIMHLHSPKHTLSSTV